MFQYCRKPGKNFEESRTEEIAEDVFSVNSNEYPMIPGNAFG